jgi:hypothetical protein
MASQAYGLADLTYTGQKIRSTTGNENLNFRVWGGALRVGIVKDKEFKATFERSLAASKVTIIKHLIDKVKKASPGSKFPMVCSVYNRDTKQWATDYVLTFLKDDKNVYHIEIQWKGNKFDCVLKGPGGIAFGSDPMSDAEKSAIELETFLDWLNYVAPVQCILTNKKREFDGSVNGASYTPNGGANKGGSAPANDDDFF